MTAVEMIGYKLSDTIGIASEGLGDSRTTYEEKIKGYPKSIVSQIKRYARFV